MWVFCGIYLHVSYIIFLCFFFCFFLIENRNFPFMLIKVFFLLHYNDSLSGNSNPPQSSQYNHLNLHINFYWLLVGLKDDDFLLSICLDWKVWRLTCCSNFMFYEFTSIFRNRQNKKTAPILLRRLHSILYKFIFLLL